MTPADGLRAVSLRTALPAASSGVASWPAGSVLRNALPASPACLAQPFGRAVLLGAQDTSCSTTLRDPCARATSRLSPPTGFFGRGQVACWECPQERTPSFARVSCTAIWPCRAPWEHETLFFFYLGMRVGGCGGKVSYLSTAGPPFTNPREPDPRGDCGIKCVGWEEEGGGNRVPATSTPSFHQPTRTRARRQLRDRMRRLVEEEVGERRKQEQPLPSPTYANPSPKATAGS